jgi:hypothetical protein
MKQSDPGMCKSRLYLRFVANGSLFATRYRLCAIQSSVPRSWWGFVGVYGNTGVNEHRQKNKIRLDYDRRRGNRRY